MPPGDVLRDAPPNPGGGATLIVDASDRSAYPRPSAALKAAGPKDQIFIRPGVYEDKIFVADRPVLITGAGRDAVQIFCRRTGPLYLQRVPAGAISGITFRYVGSDQHAVVNILDSACTLTQCRIMEAVLSGVVIYGPESRPSLIENEVCRNRESGIFAFAGARPYVAQNVCAENHHFGLAARDAGTRPDFVRNVCRANRLSGILLFHHTEALVLNNACEGNDHWGMVMTPDSRPTPGPEELASANALERNPRGTIQITDRPLDEIGR